MLTESLEGLLRYATVSPSKIPSMSSDVSGVGDTSTATKTITEDAVKAFATLSGDDNPLHLDDEYAEETMFNGTIAHGTLVEGVISAALADFDGLVIYLGKDLTFHAPVRPGDTVTVEAVITEREDNGNCTVDVVATRDDGTEVITGTAVLKITEEPDVDDEPTSSEHLSATLHFDGASRENPGPAATGYILELPNKTIEDGRALAKHTNNEAEYKALIDGVREAINAGVTDLTIKGDSQLVVRQVTGEYSCNADNLAPLLETVHGDLDKIDSWSIEHIPREENAGADAAANDALCDDMVADD